MSEGILGWVVIVWRNIRIGRLILILLLGLTSLAAEAESSQGVFVRAQCDGKIASAVLSSFKEAIRDSQKYQLVPNLKNEGRLGKVLAIYMVCTERTDFASIATTYGQGKCIASTNCGVTVDGSSLKVAICDSYAAADCGRALFKKFDDYMSNPIAPRSR